jgi:hypothetical protein
VMDWVFLSGSPGAWPSPLYHAISNNVRVAARLNYFVKARE